VPAFPLVTPCHGVNFLPVGEPHQVVPGGMELHGVDPLAVAIEALELGSEAVRLDGAVDPLRIKDRRAKLGQRLFRPFSTLAPHSLAQRTVRQEGVHVLERRGLVLDDMRAQRRTGTEAQHALLPVW
jgi:hypothetical protein